jgi:hypothetical protein
MSRLIEVEMFWDGDGYYYANVDSSERLGGPIVKLHEAWKQADSEGLEVVRFRATRGQRSYRPVRVEKSDLSAKEKDFKKYMEKAETRIAKRKKP